MTRKCQIPAARWERSLLQSIIKRTKTRIQQNIEQTTDILTTFQTNMSMLSPLAAPFMPTREGYTEFASFAAIYNDGVPEGLVCGSHADHYVIHNIPDSAIDEIFPPDAAGTFLCFVRVLVLVGPFLSGVGVGVTEFFLKRLYSHS